MVGQVGDYRHHRAIVVEQLRVAGAGGAGGVVEHVLVRRNRHPFRAALVGPGGNLAHRVGQRHRALHPRHLLQGPAQAIGIHQRLVFKTAFGFSLDDDRELVGRQRVLAVDVGVVEVVARIGAELRGPGIQVADLQLGADDKARHREDRRHHQQRGRPTAFGEALQ
ncbi:hypothetical protein D3C81_1581550 [compost metagenome]